MFCAIERVAPLKTGQVFERHVRKERSVPLQTEGGKSV